LSEIEDRLRIHPNYADLHNQLGLLSMKDGDVKKAERCFREALRINPKYREAILNLGGLYMEMKRFKEVERILLSEARRHPRDGLLQHVLGVFYIQTGRRKEAALRIRKAIECQPYYLDFYKKKGVWLRGRVHLNQKTEGIIKRIRLNYHYANLHDFIGLYLAREGKSAQAVRELRKAASMRPNEFLFHANLGTVYYHRGAYQKAIQE